MKRKLIKYMLFISTSVLALSSVIMTIEIATSGLTMSKLEMKEAALLIEKRELEESLVQVISLVELKEKSVSMGFAKTEDLIYIDEVEAVAKLP